MLSAYSAHKITIENSTIHSLAAIDSVENTLKFVFRHVRAAALAGEDYVMIPYLGTHVLSVLTSLGYIIATGHRDIEGPGIWASGEFTVICWSCPKSE